MPPQLTPETRKEAAFPLKCAPSAIAFDSKSKSLLIVNHAILSANPAHFAVLWMFVGNPGNPLDKPSCLESIEKFALGPAI